MDYMISALRLVGDHVRTPSQQNRFPLATRVGDADEQLVAFSGRLQSINY
jgi:hypothetical protein